MNQLDEQIANVKRKFWWNDSIWLRHQTSDLILATQSNHINLFFYDDSISASINKERSIEAAIQFHS